MDDVKYFLKFGEKKYLRDLTEGSLYCSNAVAFWGIEEELKIKGQGDKLEASTMMHAQKVVMKDIDTDEVIMSAGRSNGLMRIEPAENMPVFCLFAVHDSDCTYDSDGNLIISLSDEKKNTIREHFPKADGVVIIDNPDQFIEDVRRTIGVEVKDELVHYFNIDKGFQTESGQVAMDMEYMKYLVQDSEPIQGDGGIQYTFYADYAYRVLFCKDDFFKDEQEYRIVLPTESISEGTKYKVCFSSEYSISDIKEVLG